MNTFTAPFSLRVEHNSWVFSPSQTSHHQAAWDVNNQDRDHTYSETRALKMQKIVIELDTPKEFYLPRMPLHVSLNIVQQSLKDENPLGFFG